MTQLNLNWKEFNIDCEAVMSQLKSLYADLIDSSSCDYFLVVRFLREATEQEVIDIQAYWDGLTEQSAEALSYRSREQIQAAQQALKASLVAKEWAQMSAAERKAMLGLEVSKQELIAAELL
jgi:hypothetical protein